MNVNSYFGGRTVGHDGRTLLGLTDGSALRRYDSTVLGHSASMYGAGRLARVTEATSTRQLCAQGSSAVSCFVLWVRRFVRAKWNAKFIRDKSI
ncbi:MAG: hypothetical protein EOP05_07850 [Proteobacteria bacterium]|nr:MAG: hypothetical protein EOP05_07850 [Pseudomonadota bacterium]